MEGLIYQRGAEIEERRMVYVVIKKTNKRYNYYLRIKFCPYGHIKLKHIHNTKERKKEYKNSQVQR